MVTNTIELKEGQSAESGKCGACEFFQRIDGAYGGPGHCLVKFPRQVALNRSTDDNEEPSRMQDTDSCSLYRSRNVQFKQMRYWTP